jgi:hypothetical protein
VKMDLCNERDGLWSCDICCFIAIDRRQGPHWYDEHLGKVIFCGEANRMKIWIFGNNADWSDHAVAFVAAWSGGVAEQRAYWLCGHCAKGAGR